LKAYAGYQDNIDSNGMLLEKLPPDFNRMSWDINGILKGHQRKGYYRILLDFKGFLCQGEIPIKISYGHESLWVTMGSGYSYGFAEFP
jgi:hypothetical protein